MKEQQTHNEKNPAQPSYAEIVDKLAQRYMAREVAPGHEHDFEELLKETDGYDEAWREEGIEGVTSFLTPDGQYVGIGRKIKPEEEEHYKDAWQSGEYPRRRYLERPSLTDQTFRVLYGDEVRDVTIPADLQEQKPLRFMIDEGGTSLYDVTPEDILSEDLQWLVDKFGNEAELVFKGEQFVSLSTSTGRLPSVEEVARRMKSARDEAHAQALKMESDAQLGANIFLDKGAFERKSRFEKRKQRYILDELQRKSSDR